jgi:hypothetical protein
VAAEKFADGELDAEALWRVHYNAECPTFGYDLRPSVWRQLVGDAGDGRPPASVQRLLEMGILSEANLHRDAEPADPEGWITAHSAARLAESCSAQEVSLKLLFHRLTADEMRRVGWPVSDLPRCVFGNPLCPVAFDPRWRSGGPMSA